MNNPLLSSKVRWLLVQLMLPICVNAASPNSEKADAAFRNLNVTGFTDLEHGAIYSHFLDDFSPTSDFGHIFIEAADDWGGVKQVTFWEFLQGNLQWQIRGYDGFGGNPLDGLPADARRDAVRFAMEMANAQTEYRLSGWPDIKNPNSSVPTFRCDGFVEWIYEQIGVNGGMGFFADNEEQQFFDTFYPATLHQRMDAAQFFRPSLIIKNLFGGLVLTGDVTSSTSFTADANDTDYGSGISRFEVWQGPADSGSLWNSGDSDLNANFDRDHIYSISGLPDGLITVRVFDQAGHLTSVGFTIDTRQPSISQGTESPTGEIDFSPTQVCVNVDDTGGLDLARTNGSLNGTSYPVSQTGNQICLLVSSPLLDDLYNVFIQAFDLAGNSTDHRWSFRINRPLRIVDLRETNVSYFSADIEWETLRASNLVESSGLVEYGTTTNLGSFAGDSVRSSHVVTLSGLDEDTLYYYRALSSEGADTSSSSVQSFRTLKVGQGQFRWSLSAKGVEKFFVRGLSSPRRRSVFLTVPHSGGEVSVGPFDGIGVGQCEWTVRVPANDPDGDGNCGKHGNSFLRGGSRFKNNTFCGFNLSKFAGGDQHLPVCHDTTFVRSSQPLKPPDSSEVVPIDIYLAMGTVEPPSMTFSFWEANYTITPNTATFGPDSATGLGTVQPGQTLQGVARLPLPPPHAPNATTIEAYDISLVSPNAVSLVIVSTSLAGNVLYVFYDVTANDVTPPPAFASSGGGGGSGGGSLSGNGGGTSPPPTASPQVSVTWTAPPDTSGISGVFYKVGSPPTADDDGVFTTSTSFNITLAPTEGLAPVYVWAQDGLGNSSHLNRSTITFALDFTAPALADFDFSPKIVGSGQMVNVSITALDNFAGASTGRVVFVSPTGNQSVSAELLSISGSSLLSGTAAIPQFSEQGTWSVSAIELEDAAGNSVGIGPEVLALQGFPISLEVDPVQDIRPPQLVSFDFNPKTINVTSGPQTVIFRMKARDALAGVRHGGVGINPTSGSGGTGTGISNLVSGTSNEGIFEGVITFSQFSTSGAWIVGGLTLEDNLGNEARFTTADLVARGFPIQLNVISPGPDVSPPELLSFDFNPKSIDVTSEPQTVVFTMGARDPGAGVRHGSIGLNPSSGPGGTGTSMGDLVTGTRNDGVFEAQITFSPFIASGTWTVGNLALEDELGNEARLTTADLVSLGFPTTLDVVSNPDFAPPELLSFDFTPKAIDTTRGPQTVRFIGSARDLVSGVRDISAGINLAGHARGTSMSDLVSGTRSEGTFSSEILFEQFTPTGTWTIGGLTLADNIGNERGIQPSALLAAGFPTELLVGPGATGIGELVQVFPRANVEVTFSNVTQSGFTTVTTSFSPPSAPANFQLVRTVLQDPGTLEESATTYIDIDSKATFDGPIRICVTYDDAGLTLEQEQALQLLHLHEGVYENATDSGYPHTDTNQMCGTVNSFSIFVVALPLVSVPVVNAIPENIGAPYLENGFGGQFSEVTGTAVPGSNITVVVRTQGLRFDQTPVVADAGGNWTSSVGFFGSQGQSFELTAFAEKNGFITAESTVQPTELALFVPHPAAEAPVTVDAPYLQDRFGGKFISLTGTSVPGSTVTVVLRTLEQRFDQLPALTSPDGHWLAQTGIFGEQGQVFEITAFAQIGLDFSAESPTKSAILALFVPQPTVDDVSAVIQGPHQGSGFGGSFVPISGSAVPGSTVTVVVRTREQRFDQAEVLVSTSGNWATKAGIFGGENQVFHISAFARIARDFSAESAEQLSVLDLLDTTPPVSSLTIDEPKVSFPSDGGKELTIVGPATPISLTAEDPNDGLEPSGVKEIHRRVSGGEWQVVNSTSITFQLVEDDGLKDIRFFALDNAGNFESTKTTTLAFDKASPQTRLTVGEPQVFREGQPLLVSGRTSLTLTAIDPIVAGVAAGTDKSRFRVAFTTDTAYEDYVGPIFLASPDGIQVFEYLSLDRVMNQEAANRIEIELDSTSPGAALISPSPNAQGIDQVIGGVVPIYGSASDTHFASYRLEFSTDPSGLFTEIFSSASAPESDSLLANWDTTGLSGNYTLRLVVIDQVQNISLVSAPVFIGAPQASIAFSGPDMKHPQGISVAPSGGLWVANTNHDSIDEFDVRGNFLRTIGSQAKKDPLSFNKPYSIAIHETDLWVADTNKHRVVKLSQEGSILSELGQRNPSGGFISGSGAGAFNHPSDVFIATDGRVYVSDQNNARIQVFSALGSHLQSIDVIKGDAVRPYGIAGDTEGTLYVTDESNGRLIKMDSNGNTSISATGLLTPQDVILSPGGFLYVAERDGDRIVKLDRFGNIIARFGSPGKAAGHFNKPTGLAFGADGTLYVADQNNSRIQGFSLGGKVAALGATTAASATLNSLDAAFELGEIYAYPNPSKGGQHPTIHIESGLADNVNIRIYDLAGDLMHEAEIVSSPQVVDDGQGAQYAYEYRWDVSGVASGVYIGVVHAHKNGHGELRKTFKVAVIK